MPCTELLARRMDSSSLLLRSPPGRSAEAARDFARAPSKQSAEALRQQLRSLPADSDLQSEIDGVITEFGGSQGNAEAGWEAILDVVSEQSSAPQAQRRLSPDGQIALAVRCAAAMQTCGVRTEPLWGKLIDIVRGATGTAGLDALATVTCALVKLNIDAPVLLDPIEARFKELGSGDPPPASERTYEMCLQVRSMWGCPEPAAPNHAKVLCAAARTAASVGARDAASATKLIEAFVGHGTPDAAASAAVTFFALQHSDVAALKTVAASINTPKVWLAVLPALARMPDGPRSTVWFTIRYYIKTTALYDSFSPEGQQLARDEASLDQQITRHILANAGAFSLGQVIAVLTVLSGPDATQLADHLLSRMGPDAEVSLLRNAADAMLRASIASNSPLWQRLLGLPGDGAKSLALASQMVELIAERPAARSWLWASLLQRALAAPADDVVAALCAHIRRCVGRFPQSGAPSADDRRLIEQLTAQVVQNVAGLTLEPSTALLEVLVDGEAVARVANHPVQAERGHQHLARSQRGRGHAACRHRRELPVLAAAAEHAPRSSDVGRPGTAACRSHRRTAGNPIVAVDAFAAAAARRAGRCRVGRSVRTHPSVRSPPPAHSAKRAIRRRTAAHRRVDRTGRQQRRQLVAAACHGASRRRPAWPGRRTGGRVCPVRAQ